ncbi:ATP-dependent DNA helicase [Elysia marginata]|uniref:ATP-dependent DNA helicase n=1 Tax=Elysia marginata TaxID=1093978 RepID=A0AAV4GTP1_9GAST|nr:ATP-dependent DNA helicase [Elysia marginata]
MYDPSLLRYICIHRNHPSNAVTPDTFLPQAILTNLTKLGINKHKTRKRFRGKRAGKRKQRAITVINSTRPLFSKHNPLPKPSVPRILIPIDTCRDPKTSLPSPTLKVCLVNVQSVRNKTTDIADLIEELSADIAFLTESWLYPNGDEVYLHEITPVGYTASSYPRLNGRGGGICVLSRKELNLKSHRISRYQTFEGCECTLSQYGLSTTFFCLYRPPPNQKNRLNAKDFLN